MNLRDLDYVLAVAESGHFGRAAKACNVSQPTLSGQIKKLEDELGVQLFERGRGGAKPTDAGRAVAEQARVALRAATEIRQIAQAAQDPFAGEFRLGLIPTVAPYLIPRFVARMRNALPDLSVIYREDITERLIRDLEAGTIDAAILATPPDSDALQAIPLYTEPFRLVFPDGHDLSSLAHLRMSDVNRQEMLLLTEGHCFRDQALAICDAQSTQTSLRATSLETLINLVAQGQGVTLVPALAMAGLSDELGLEDRTLEDDGAARAINLTIRRSTPRRALTGRVAEIIRSGLPDTVTVAEIG
ncbi:LysR family transcriptional regulator [Algimonas ampicilliniresistens]|uniref:LysR family transcriptional regulator n=1 Tax=Algimonas ampicilliniresistens TaxID=1298735 RepID=A0ABQ5V9J5_9PROT|nr:LysR substrate-binding domain-containing protein [Algimonas ampicilliniresistens]GLQ24153.1 LysR family transcriptional regulator [Algimonas ampicilliniresistens]